MLPESKVPPSREQPQRLGIVVACRLATLLFTFFVSFWHHFRSTFSMLFFCPLLSLTIHPFFPSWWCMTAFFGQPVVGIEDVRKPRIWFQQWRRPGTWTSEIGNCEIAAFVGIFQLFSLLEMLLNWSVAGKASGFEDWCRNFQSW